MFEKITPEKAGIESRYVREFIEFCERHGLVMHSVLMMRGTSLFEEAYWAPFTKDFCHRMYSETKSYESVAIGLLQEDGLIDLDQPIASYFPEKIERVLPNHLKTQTIREMLTMTTAVRYPNWFTSGDPDRVHLYLNRSRDVRPAGTYFEYDSTGSQVLSTLVEKISGQSLFDFLNERIFKTLGTFKTATILKTPSGASWGDSALVCTPRDMMSFARFVMNYGTWNGERLMGEDYLREATKKQVANNIEGFDHCDAKGYGYQFWMTEENGFSFNGMGGQYTVCVPEKDFIFVCTGDNQGFQNFNDLLFSKLFDTIVDHLTDQPLPENEAEVTALQNLEKTLKLSHIKGETASEVAERIQGKTFLCDENEAGITRFSFDFKEDGTGIFSYTNAQGDKELPFGLNKNVFGKFPQYGYSDGVGAEVTTNGFLYDCAASAAWCDPTRLVMKVQIIDRYFGNFTATFAFKGDEAGVFFHTSAENFLKEYTGIIAAKTAD